MTSIGVDEARTRLSELLDQVARGKTILITRRGKPAALLSPPPADTLADVRQVIEEFKAYSKRQGRTLGGATFRDLIEEGRRSPAEASNDVRQVIAAMKALRRGNRLGEGLSIRDLIQEGRRC